MTMTAFITHCYKKSSLLFFAVAFLCIITNASAAAITIEKADLLPVEDSFQLDAEFGVDLSPDVEDALNKGVALYFLVEFALMETHRYWFDQEVSSASQMAKLSYHALSRQYLLNIANHQYTFATLQEATKALSTIENWIVVEKSQLKRNANYYAMLRMRLDQNRLPKALQVSVMGSEKWNLISDRHRWVPNFEKPSVERLVPEKSSIDRPGAEKISTDK